MSYKCISKLCTFIFTKYTSNITHLGYFLDLNPKSKSIFLHMYLGFMVFSMGIINVAHV
jgi:hypothetical protein